MDDVSKCLDQSIESLDHECLNVFLLIYIHVQTLLLRKHKIRYLCFVK